MLLQGAEAQFKEVIGIKWLLKTVNAHAKQSETFLSDTSEFPEVLNAAKFILERHWVLPIPRSSSSLWDYG